jgi:uncharacterized membrane protein
MASARTGVANAPTGTLLALAALACVVTLALTGAIAGFFYAYSSTVMRGFDAIEPHQAIAAMQGINANVRNAVFAPAFFGTPLAAVVTGVIFLVLRWKSSAILMFLAAAAYILGAFLPTLLINVPMNEELALVGLPREAESAALIWSSYSTRWTWWNSLRAVFSTTSLIFVGCAILAAGRRLQ